jgi:hypothetical protein
MPGDGATASKVEDVLATATFYTDIYSGTSPAITYTPLIKGRERHEFDGMVMSDDKALLQAFSSLLPHLLGLLGSERLQIDGEVAEVKPTIQTVTILTGREEIQLSTSTAGGERYTLHQGDLSSSQAALVDSLKGTVKRIAWDDLRERFLRHPSDSRPKVLISYRRGHEKFAEAVAHRLGKEGIVPLFDKWESRAGDSIPGKIAEWPNESMACVIVVTEDYERGTWATVEFDGAITKRATEGYTVVPLVLDNCPVPELLKPLVQVHFTTDAPSLFEANMVDVINAIYRIELNPYR